MLGDVGLVVPLLEVLKGRLELVLLRGELAAHPLVALGPMRGALAVDVINVCVLLRLPFVHGPLLEVLEDGLKLGLLREELAANPIVFFALLGGAVAVNVTDELAVGLLVALAPHGRLLLGRPLLGRLHLG